MPPTPRLRAALLVVAVLALAGPPLLAPGAAHAGRALLEAAGQGDLAAVRAGIAAGGDVNCRDGHGATPLWEAARHGHPEVIRALAAAGADPNATDHRGWTVLMRPMYEKRLETVHALLHHGADPDRIGPEGATAYRIATATHQHHMIFALRNARARQGR